MVTTRAQTKLRKRTLPSNCSKRFRAYVHPKQTRLNVKQVFHSDPLRKIPDYISANTDFKVKPYPKQVINPVIRSSAQHPMNLIKFGYQFSCWRQYLAHNLNLLLYGPGSKQHILTGFMQYLTLSGMSVIVAEAYRDTFSIKTLLVKILSYSGKSEILPMDVDLLLTYVLRWLRTTSKHLFILLHNIDSPSLFASQEILGQLGSLSQIHLAATLDNPHLLLLWAPETRFKLNFKYLPVATYEQYGLERNSPLQLRLFTRRDSKKHTTGFLNVLKSMTETQRNILKCLARCQAQQANKLTLKDLFLTCKEQMLVHNINQLHKYLSEAKDHQIIALKHIECSEILITLHLNAIELLNL